jgi:hypothetical protein
MDALRSEALTPRFLTVAPPSPEGRQELVRGAELLRLHGPRAARGATIQGHQVLLADLLAQPHEVMALLEPRRSFKTSTLFSIAMGRISTRMDYMVAYTMTTTAIKARQRFRDDIVKPLELLYPDPKDRPFKLVKAGGSERVEWLDTGSVLAFLAPKGDSFRSDAWDWIILDEAGQADPEMGADILDGAAATQDTRNGHMTITGTAPRYRTGNLLWEALEKGRTEEPGYSILEYSVSQETQPEEYDEWEKAEPLVLAMHPTIGHPTPLTAIRKSYGLIGAHSFGREYLGIAGTEGATPGLLDVIKWNAAGLDTAMPAPPSHFRIGVAVSSLGDRSAIVAAWREDGVACFGVLAALDGVGSFGSKLRSLWGKYKVPYAYDTITSTTNNEMESLGRTAPKPRVEPFTSAAIAGAASLLYKEVKDGNIRHWNHDGLNAAVNTATKRKVANDKRWWFMKGDPEVDITLLEAAALALWSYDLSKPKTTYKGVVVTK